MIWKPMGASEGVIKGRMWSEAAGRSVTTHRRGYRARVWVEGSKPPRIEACSHAHRSRGAGLACAKSWANWKNTNRCCVHCGVREDMHDERGCTNFEAPST